MTPLVRDGLPADSSARLAAATEDVLTGALQAAWQDAAAGWQLP